jgi:(p)ppGpp synthase/HD superfamily hydrolase
MTKAAQGTQLTQRFEEALLYAAELHAEQRRKRSNIPYLAHLLAVTALVLADGGNEDEAIAALLHDAVEDQGGMETFKEIDQRFGSEGAHIVLEVSDSTEIPKPPWRARKEQYLTSLSDASPSAILVSLADKLNNARTILHDLEIEGEDVWERFNGGKDGTLWYYDELIQAFQRRESGWLLDELVRTVAEIHRLTDCK